MQPLATECPLLVHSCGFYIRTSVEDTNQVGPTRTSPRAYTIATEPRTHISTHSGEEQVTAAPVRPNKQPLLFELPAHLAERLEVVGPLPREL